MKYTETPIAGAWLIEPEQRADARGWFARSWCTQEFEKLGLNPRLVQCNISWNQSKGTLRGMHYQKAPYGEAKLVRVTSGSIYDVIVDLRPESATYRQWFGVELSRNNYRMLYIPEGLAHGFQTLTDDAEVFYQMSQSYHAGSAAGVRWNDPAFGIQWPDCDSRLISDRDAAWPDLVS